MKTGASPHPPRGYPTINEEFEVRSVLPRRNFSFEEFKSSFSALSNCSEADSFLAKLPSPKPASKKLKALDFGRVHVAVKVSEYCSLYAFVAFLDGFGNWRMPKAACIIEFAPGLANVKNEAVAVPFRMLVVGVS